MLSFPFQIQKISSLWGTRGEIEGEDKMTLRITLICVKFDISKRYNYNMCVRACVRLTGQFRVLMDRRNQPGRSDSENGNRPEQSDSENGNPSPDDWCAASFVHSSVEVGQFHVLMDRQNPPERSDFENGNPGPDDWCAASFVRPSVQRGPKT
jgi:hypothetical protein